MLGASDPLGVVADNAEVLGSTPNPNPNYSLGLL